MHLLEEIFDDLFFVIARRGVYPIATFLQLITLVDEQGGVASIIDNELWPGAVGMTQRLVSAPPVFFQGFPFPGKDRVACLRNGGSGVVLSGKILQLAQRTVAPRSAKVSMRTAVWIVMCSEPVIRTPARGLSAACFSRMAMRPGISFSAMLISLDPNRPMRDRLPCSPGWWVWFL